MEEELSNELLSETQVIEQQPLSERANSFEHIYERLLAQLQRTDSNAG